METVIADTGPLVAYLKSDDADHKWALGCLQELPPPLFSCEAVLSEAFFLLRQTPGGVTGLVELIERRLLVTAFDFAAESGAYAASLGQVPRRSDVFCG